MFDVDGDEVLVGEIMDDGPGFPAGDSRKTRARARAGIASTTQGRTGRPHPSSADRRSTVIMTSSFRPALLIILAIAIAVGVGTAVLAAGTKRRGGRWDS